MYSILLLLSAQVVLTSNTPYRVDPLLTSSRDEILHQPTGLAEDAAGNLYIAERQSNRIRRIAPDGTLETWAPANSPTALLITPDQDLLYFDSEECMIRRIRPDRTVEDIAGSGTCAVAAGFNGPLGFAGGFGASNDRDGKALETTLGIVGAMIYDNEGRLTFTESSLHIIRRLNPDGNLETISGTRQSGYAGDNQKAVDATLSNPTGLAADAEGNLWVADSGNCRIRRIDVTSYIETWIGTGTCASSSAPLTGTRAIAIEQPGSLVFDRDANALFFALPRAYRVLRFNVEENRVSPVLGNGKLGITPADNPLDCPINDPGTLLRSPLHGLLVAAPSSFQIFQLQNNTAARFAGKWPTTELLDPRGLLTASDGATLVLDSATNRLLRIDAERNITTLAGTIWPSGFAKGDNGPALDATLDAPIRMVQAPNGDIIIAEATRLRLLRTDGTLRTIRTGLNNPTGLAIDPAGQLLIADSGNHRILRMNLATNVATRIAGDNGEGFSGDNAAATAAKLNNPGDIVIDSAGNILFADRGNRRIRRISPSGTISTIIGNGLPFSYADITGELATRTGFGFIAGLAIDSTNNLYLSEEKRLTRIAANNRVEILTGYQQQADDGTITWLNEPLERADAILIAPDGALLYTVRDTATIQRAQRP